jgi:undecaprenyl diphosphate synthase
MKNFFSSLDLKKLPAHIAIIMDGNGRWAKKHNLPIIEGHTQGIKAVREVVEGCRELGIKYLTLYTFSEENWKRSPTEVKSLMNLLYEHLETELEELKENNVKVQFMGRLYKFPLKIRQRINKMIIATSENSGLILTLALSYSGRAEIVDAVQKIINSKIKKINVKTFKNYLYLPNLPDPDLIIRTSGEMRISNFLLYQLAYSELYITSVLWPDFSKEELGKAIYEFQQRKRRFGGR